MSRPVYILSGVDSTKKMPVIDKVEDDIAVLFNVPALARGSAQIKNANEIINLRKNRLVVVDSGGKQIAEINSGRSRIFHEHLPDPSKPIRVRRTLHLSPEHLAQAVQRLTRVSILMCLDDPIIPSNDPQERERRFYEKLPRNMEWAQNTVALRDALFPHVKVFLPIQSQELKHFEILWRKARSLRLDGLSLPQRCFKNAKDMLPFLQRFRELGISGFHFLGSSRLEIVALLCILGRRNFFHHTAFDSTTWQQAAIRGKLILPNSLTELNINTDEFSDTAQYLRRQNRIYRDHDIQKIHQMSNAEQRQCLRTLNVAAIINTRNEIYECADSANSIFDFLRRKKVSEKIVYKISALLSKAEKLF